MGVGRRTPGLSVGLVAPSPATPPLLPEPAPATSVAGDSRTSRVGVACEPGAEHALASKKPLNPTHNIAGFSVGMNHLL
jgi:hypothetical protein